MNLGVPGQLDPRHTKDWGDDRCIPADVLRLFLKSFSTVDPRGLQISGARFKDSLDLAEINFPHPLHLTNCAFDGVLDLSGARISELCIDGSCTQEIQLDGAEISRSLIANGLTTQGEVRAIGMVTGGQLLLNGSTLRNRTSAEIDLDQFHADNIGDVVGSEAAEMDFSALTLDHAHIKGALHAAGLITEGSVAMNSIYIGGSLNLQDARLRRGWPESLNLGGATITSGLYSSGLQTTRAFRAPEMKVEGEFQLQNAKLGKTDDVVSAGLNIVGGYSLSLRGASVATDIDATNLLTAGEIRAPGARVGGAINLTNAKIYNSKGPDGGNSINFDSACINRLILDGVRNRGVVRLNRASITDLKTDASPPKPLVATGWEVKDINGPLRDKWRPAHTWLKSTTEPSVQSWQALAATYERNGETAGARRLRVAAAWKLTRQARPLTKGRRTVYGLVAGHGYYPGLAILWIVVIVLGATLLVSKSHSSFESNKGVTNAAAIDYLTQTKATVPVASLEPFSYVMSALLPTAVGNSSTSDWNVRSDAAWLGVTLLVLKLFAWILTALIIAGVGGLLRKS